MVFMACGAIDFSNPYLWLTLGGLFFGGGLSYLIAYNRRRSPTVFIVFLSISLLALLTALILSNFDIENLSFRLFWTIVCAALGFLGFFFWKAAGVPLLFITVILLSVSWSSFYDWKCALSGTQICTFRMISKGEGFMRIQYETASGEKTINRIEGDEVYPVIEIIEMPSYFFIINSRHVYRFNGFNGTASGSDEVSLGFIMKQLLNLPGMNLSREEFEPLKVSPSVEYIYRFGDAAQIEVLKNI